MNFCGGYVYEHICVPVASQVWPEWSIKSKDFLVESLTVLYLEQRLIQELNQNRFSEEFAEVAGLELTSYPECLDSYIRFYCRLNFPMCDEFTGETIPVCPTDCANAFLDCGMLESAAECEDDRIFRNIGEGGEPSCIEL